MPSRSKWNSTWILFAGVIAGLSHDKKLKVGCVIVDKRNEKILSFGYNGNYAGGSNDRDSMEKGCSGFIHAEENALIKLPYGDHGGCTMYLTHSPCRMCAKKIINARIKNVVYLNDYGDDDFKFMFLHSGVRFEKIKT